MLFVSLRSLRNRINAWFIREHRPEPAHPFSRGMTMQRSAKASFDSYATLTVRSWLPKSLEPQEPSTRNKGR
jgi:hypothetical protein